MNGIYLMLFGFIGCVVGIVFLFFDNIRITGVFIFGISIISVFMGFRRCNNGSYYSYNDSMEQKKMTQKKNWKETVENTPKGAANILIQEEIDRIKKELIIDSFVIYEKCREDLKLSIASFKDRLVNEMNLKEGKKSPFKALDFFRLSRFKKQVNWVNSIKFVVPISDQLIHVSGVLSNDSSCIVYDGYLNPSTKTIYWTGFRPEELIVTTHNNYSQYESPSKFLDLTNSSKGLRVDLIYWQAQKIARFITRKLAFRKDQQTKAVLFEGAFIPFYKVSKIKENGDVILREFFNY